MEDYQEGLTTPTQESPDPPPEIAEDGQRVRGDMWRAVVLFAIFGATFALAMVPAAKLPALISFIGLGQEGREPPGRVAEENRADAPAISTSIPRNPPQYFAQPTQKSYSPQIVQATPIPSPRLSESFGATSAVQSDPLFGDTSVGIPGAWPSALPEQPFGRLPAAPTATGNRSTALGARAKETSAPETSIAGGVASAAGENVPPPAETTAENETAFGGFGLRANAGDTTRRLAEMEAQLRRLGALRYRLERWGQMAELYRFTCEMPVPGVSGMSRLWQSVAASPEEAVAEVLREILRDGGLGPTQ